MRELTYKQRLFVAYYLGEANGNATEAGRMAGYALPTEQGYENLRKPHIRAAIDRKLKTVALSQDEVLARISEIATSDMGEFIDIGNGTWKVDLKRTQRTRLIKKLKQTRTIIKDYETEVTEIEVKDSFPALVKLGEYHSLWNKEPEQPQEDGVMDELEKRASERSSKKPASGHLGPVQE